MQLAFGCGVPGTVREPIGAGDTVRPGDRVHAAWDADAGAVVSAGGGASDDAITARAGSGAAMMDGAGDAGR